MACLSFLMFGLSVSVLRVGLWQSRVSWLGIQCKQSWHSPGNQKWGDLMTMKHCIHPRRGRARPKRRTPGNRGNTRKTERDRLTNR